MIPTIPGFIHSRLEAQFFFLQPRFKSTCTFETAMPDSVIDPKFIGNPALLGVVTDIQYANKRDQTMGELYGPSAKETIGVDPSTPRYFSKILSKTRNAVEQINAAKVDLTIHLGDIIDGNETVEGTRAELLQVMDRLKGLESPMLHVVGNHCLAVGRSHLLSTLGFAKDDAYYTRPINDTWQLIVLDTVDVSVLRDRDDPSYEAAVQYLQQHPDKPNSKPWNGGISEQQKKWLVETLLALRMENRKAIVCGHHPVFMDGHLPVPLHVLWDNESVACVFEQFKDVVKAYFAGHFHQGGYIERNGIHYVIFESILDSQHDDGSYAIVKLFNNAIVIDGHGDMSSRTLVFNNE